MNSIRQASCPHHAFACRWCLKARRQRWALLALAGVFIALKLGLWTLYLVFTFLVD